MIEISPPKSQGLGGTTQVVPNGQEGPIEFKLFSGRGFGVQVVNYAKVVSTFEIEMEPIPKEKKIGLS